MKIYIAMLSLLLTFTTATAQTVNDTNKDQQHDSTDVFFQHLQLNETVVTGVTGETKMKHSSTPIMKISSKELRQSSSTNIIDAISKQPGVAQLTTGSGISKPIIRGLGYNRIVTINDGVRQEGQQWGDEHGIEIDANSVGSVEILKGPASLMYGSDAMAGVIIMHPTLILPEGSIKSSLSTEYQSNNGMINYSANTAGNYKGFVWDARYSGKNAHAYKNKYDGYVPGSQFSEQAARLMLGLNRNWGFSRLTFSLYHQQPSITEGERDSATGQLESNASKAKTYGHTLPFQNINHYKIVADNTFNIGKGKLKATIGYQQNQRKEYEEEADECELFMKLHTLTYDVRYAWTTSGNINLATGINGMWQQSVNYGEESLIPNYALFDIGGYATASKSFENWTLNGGLRIDNRHHNFNHNNFTGLTGSIGAVWNLSRNANIRLNVARGFRAPNMSELGSDGVHEGTLRYELGNSNLKSEYSWQADLGADFTSRYFSLQAAVFANRIQNYIFAHRVDIVKKEGMQTFSYTQGNARLIGAEIGVDFHPIHSIHFENTFSIVDARKMGSSSDMRYLPMTPAPRLMSELKYEINHGYKHLLSNAFVAMGMQLYFRQSHYFKAFDTETATPAYTLYNISAGSDLAVHGKKIADIFLSVENLFDKAYQNHLSRLKYADINEKTGRAGVFNMGRNIVAKIRFEF